MIDKPPPWSLAELLLYFDKYIEYIPATPFLSLLCIADHLMV